MRTISPTPALVALTTALSIASRLAHAQEALPPAPMELPPARAYVHGSVSMEGGGVAYTGAYRYGTSESYIGIGGRARFVHQGLAIELQSGLTYQQSVAPGTDTMNPNHSEVVSLGGGVGVGYAFAVGENVAVTPMLTYAAYADASWMNNNGTTYRDGGIMHAISARLPVTLFVSRHVFLEPHVGLTYFTGYVGHELSADVGWSLGVTL